MLGFCSDRKPNLNPNSKPICNPSPFPIPNSMPLTYDLSYDNQIAPEKKFAVTLLPISGLIRANRLSV